MLCRNEATRAAANNIDLTDSAVIGTQTNTLTVGNGNGFRILTASTTSLAPGHIGTGITNDSPTTTRFVGKTATN